MGHIWQPIAGMTGTMAAEIADVGCLVRDMGAMVFVRGAKIQEQREDTQDGRVVGRILVGMDADRVAIVRDRGAEAAEK